MKDETNKCATINVLIEYIPAAVAIVLGVILLLFSVGCSSGRFRLGPTEQQKQAADLAVTDIIALKSHVAATGEPIRQEAVAAAKVTQTYLGLPKTRLASAKLENKPAIQAASNIAAARPTNAEVAIDAIDTGITTLDAVIGLVGVIAGTWGFGKVAGKIVSLRDRARVTGDALRETVRAIESAKADISPEAIAALRSALSQAQSPTSKHAVDAIRR